MYLELTSDVIIIKQDIWGCAASKHRNNFSYITWKSGVEKDKLTSKVIKIIN